MLIQLQEELFFILQPQLQLAFQYCHYLIFFQPNFLEYTPVLGLREGCMLRAEGEALTLRGTTAARLMRRGAAPEEFAPPCDLSFLLSA